MNGRTDKQRVFIYQQSVAGIALFAGIVLVYICTFIPPKGEVSTSILTFFGTLCTFTGAVFGVTSVIQKGIYQISTENEKNLKEIKEEINKSKEVTK